jgi:spore coat protein CotH
MRILRTYFIWLAIPAVILTLAFIFVPFETEDEIPNKSPADLIHIKSDKKLNRTVKNWIGELNANSSEKDMGVPGLPVEMFIKEDEWEALQNKSNRRSFKKNRYDFVIQLNNKTSYVGTYKLRGASSLKRAYKKGIPDRLCYNIKLFKSIRFGPDVKLKKFYLMNMIYDPYYFKMRFSYKLLHSIGLFPSYHQFIALKVNGKPQGIYLLVERPQDAVVRTKSNVIGVYRRRNPENGQKVFETKYQKPQENEMWQINRLYEIIHTHKGEELESEIRNIMDLDAYLTWLAFNSLMMCSDTLDEIYYYISTSKDFPRGRIEFSAWDYDELLNPKQPSYAIKDPLMFGCEDEIDKYIQSDMILYNRYKSTLKNLLTKKMTKAYLKKMLNDIEQEGDQLSTGLPMEDERRLKIKRKEVIKIFESELLARHSELLRKLDN